MCLNTCSCTGFVMHECKISSQRIYYTVPFWPVCHILFALQQHVITQCIVIKWETFLLPRTAKWFSVQKIASFPKAQRLYKSSDGSAGLILWNVTNVPLRIVEQKKTSTIILCYSHFLYINPTTSNQELHPVGEHVCQDVKKSPPH